MYQRLDYLKPERSRIYHLEKAGLMIYYGQSPHISNIGKEHVMVFYETINLQRKQY